MKLSSPFTVIVVLLLLHSNIQVILSQEKGDSSTATSTLNKSRFYLMAGTGAFAYGSAVWALQDVWYSNTERTSFQFFNDWKEWQNIDKAGHAYAAYFQSELSYKALKWAGMKDKTALWLSSGLAFMLQGTIEMFDAYSAKWGFSWHDIAFNTAGIALHTGQQLGWQDQRLRLKVSSWPKSHPPGSNAHLDPVTSLILKNRGEALFGTSWPERYLKDYNQQTIWLSINLASFLPKRPIPPWLNVAVGYGGDHLYGGFANTWLEDDQEYQLPDSQFPRTREWYLSPDIDFSRIRTESKWLKSIFTVLNLFKIPAPALELDSQGKVTWHWVFL